MLRTGTLAVSAGARTCLTRLGHRSIAASLALLALALTAPPAIAGSAEAHPDPGAGRPLVRNFHYRDFGAEAQNWDVLQGHDGLVYFANNAGVLEYDGRKWRLIELPARLAVRSLTLGPGDGRIYVGAQGDVGYLAPDEAGTLEFTSLLPAHARRDRSFTGISSPVVTRSGVYFHVRRSVCRSSSGQLRCRETSSPLSGIFAVGDHAYVHQVGVGLMQIVESSLAPVPGGSRFANDAIAVVLPFDEGGTTKLLVGTRRLGLYLQRGDTFEPFGPGIADPVFPGDELVSGAVLLDGTLAFGTRLRGMLVVDREGRIRQRIDRSTGLQDNHVHGIWPDPQGGLWLALQHGVSRVELGSPFTIFDEASGLEREWREVVRRDGVLYVRGYKGLFAGRLPEDQGAPPLRFSRMPELEPPVWSLVDVGHAVLATSKDGVYSIESGRRPRKIKTYRSLPMTLFPSRGGSNRVYVGLADGLASLRYERGEWIDEGLVEGIDESITAIAEGSAGDLWLVAQMQRPIRVRFAQDIRKVAGPRPAVTDVQRFGPETMTGRVGLRTIAGRAVFLSETDIFAFDQEAQAFRPFPGLAVLAASGRRSFSWIAEDPHGNVWVASRRPGRIDFLWKQPDGGYVLDSTGVRQIPVWSIYPDPQGSLVWFCTADYLLRYDPSVRQETPAAFRTLLRQIVADGDRVVFGGASGWLTPEDGQSPAIELPADVGHSLRFEFAANSYDDAERNEFQSLLEGLDKGWSAWDGEGARVYTNLRPGHYRFRVRARDVRGRIGDEAVVAFTVLPPWHQSAWAYAMYGSIACCGLVASWRHGRRRVRLKREREREQLELEKLREIDRMKSRFFADVSHEFRTPLTLILGPVGQMLESTSDPETKRLLSVVHRNAEYLMRLIAQILDLSKLESCGMPLRVAEGDLARELSAIVSPFVSVAETKGIHLQLDLPSEPWPGAFFDRDVVEKTVNNLLANALKFTPTGGTVSVRLRRGSAAAHARGGPADDTAEIAVSDSGIGIAPEHLPHVFERFYQAGGGRSREGFGIGLALVKELVELHRGHVAVQSTPGRGTTFVVTLPTARDRFTAEEIAPGPALPAADRVPPAALIGPEPAAALPEPAPASAPTGDDRPTVLVVEDHAELRAFLREQLETRYRVIEAADGPEGLRQAVSELPGLVLSDVMMREMDGYELCRALKTDKRTGHIPVVLLTARAGSEDRVHGVETGADCYLVKPFEPRELLAHVHNLLEGRRLLRRQFSGSVILKPSEVADVPADEAFLARVLEVIERHIEDPEFDVEQLGRAVGLSRSQLHRKLRALTHQPPTLMIRSIRLRRGADLLARQAGSIAEIAYRVGFSSQAYFAKCFREEFGVSPSEYRANGASSPPNGAGANDENVAMRQG